MASQIQLIINTPINSQIIRSIKVVEQLNQHTTCSVELWNTKDQKILVESWLGQTMQVTAIDDAGQSSMIFNGFVIEATRYHEAAGDYTAFVEGITHSHKLDLTHDEKYFQNKGLTEVAQAITAEDGLTANVQCSQNVQYNYVQWAGENDFEFLVRLADDHQAWIRPSPTDPTSIDICDQFQSDVSLDWCTEGNLIRFGISGRLGQPSFKGTHYDFLKTQSNSYLHTEMPATFGGNAPMVNAVQQGSKSAMVPGALYTDHRAPTAERYEANLKREASRSLAAGVSAHGMSRVPAVKAGNTVTVTGENDSDNNGTYGVTRVVHLFDWQNGYRNEFWGTTWQQWISPQRPQPKPMDGVVVARVVDNNDPHGIGQLTIRYDWLGDGVTGWTRMASLHAGGGRGMMFMPEKGDEVIVAFEHGDPERPIVIGSLWNTANNAPRYGSKQQPYTPPAISTFDQRQLIGTEATNVPSEIAQNNVKRLVTKSGNTIHMVDTEDSQSIVLSVPNVGSVKIVQNAAETKRDIVAITCDNGDIFLGAPNGRVHIRSKFHSQITGTLPNS